MSQASPITVCKGIAGLGNRLLFLTEALRRCQRIGSRLFVCWNDYMYSDAESENAFTQAFMLDPRFDAGLREIAELRGSSVSPQLWSGFVERDIYSLPDSYRCVSAASVALDDPAPATSVEVMFGTPPPYRRTSDLDRLAPLLVRHIRVAPSVARETTVFFGERLARGPSLGVHVRQCSWEKRKIDRDDLHRRTEAFLVSSPDAHVFLATDGADVAHEWRARFGDRVVMRPKWMSREPHAVGRAEPSSLHRRRPGLRQPGEPPASVLLRDAVVELTLLASCDRLLYQHDSSFSVVAGLFGRAAGNEAEPWGEHSLTLRESLVTHMLASAAAAIERPC